MPASPTLANKSYLHTLQYLTPRTSRKTLDIPAYNLRREQTIASVVPEGAPAGPGYSWNPCSQGAILSRNSHILGVLSITALESRFCDFRSRRRPVTPTFPGFSIASHLESGFYRQLADSRDFTEIAEKLNAKDPPSRHSGRSPESPYLSWDPAPRHTESSRPTTPAPFTGMQFLQGAAEEVGRVCSEVLGNLLDPVRGVS